MAWRIYIKNPTVQNTTSTAHDSTVTPATRKIGSGAEAVTLFAEGAQDWWYPCDAFMPTLPGQLSGTVTMVTFVGAPPSKLITPGLYEISTSFASVERNGEKLKVELVAPSIDAARELWRKLLQNDEGIRTASYESAA